MAKVVFSITMPHRATPIADHAFVLTIMDPVAELADMHVEKAVECFLEDEWDELFGSESADENVIVDVHEPHQLLGRYEVSLERKISARAVGVEHAAAAESPVG